MREVAYKRQRWRQKDRERAEHYLITHPIPVILGLESRHFILDRHHLTRALCDEGVVQVPISIVANESSLPHDEFWAVLERYYWVHPFDDKGERVAYRNIPKSISKLIDDPYRSLAGALKRAGGYTKDKSPFSEFRWADFLRSRSTAKVSPATSTAHCIRQCIWRKAPKQESFRVGWISAPWMFRIHRRSRRTARTYVWEDPSLLIRIVLPLPRELIPNCPALGDFFGIKFPFLCRRCPLWVKNGHSRRSVQCPPGAKGRHAGCFRVSASF